MSCNLGSYKGWLLTFTTISCESSYFEWLSFLLTLEDNNKMNSITNVCLHTVMVIVSPFKFFSSTCLLSLLTQSICEMSHFKVINLITCQVSSSCEVCSVFGINVNHHGFGRFIGLHDVVNILKNVYSFLR